MSFGRSWGDYNLLKKMERFNHLTNMNLQNYTYKHCFREFLLHRDMLWGCAYKWVSRRMLDPRQLLDYLEEDHQVKETTSQGA
jgi:hypothetical protein